ncbi:MAG: hypothetical protein K940chlam8_00845 [Chlamydiae bacterium]|nr:hypothetical protein [Chlamydiota bacterium]
MRQLLVFIFCSALLFAHQELLSIHLLDHHGMYQTHQDEKKLKSFESQDFLSAQPYQKVVRVFKTENQKTQSIITSYYPSGQVCAFLECVDGRAKGVYKEWYESGKPKIEAFIKGGMADLTNEAEKSWVFHKCAKAYFPSGRIEALLQYDHGKLHGFSTFYYPNKNVKKLTSYHENQKHLKCLTFFETGALKKESHFQHGKLHGSYERFFENGTLYSVEKFDFGKLEKGVYFNKKGKILSKIEEGAGIKTLHKKNMIIKSNYVHGQKQGKTEIFDSKGELLSHYHVYNGKKHGRQVEFYPHSQQPRLAMFWVEDQIQGLVETWYPSGQLESQKEMSHNQKYGLSVCYYESGAVMMVEEYVHDKLKDGEYYKKGQKTPFSKITNGKGLATLFDPRGSFDKEIIYENFEPLITDLTH